MNSSSERGDFSEADKLPVHVLNTSVGVKVEATLDPKTFEWTCVWSPPPPFSKKKVKQIALEYFPWRDRIFRETAQQMGVRVAVITPGQP